MKKFKIDYDIILNNNIEKHISIISNEIYLKSGSDYILSFIDISTGQEITYKKNNEQIREVKNIKVKTIEE